MRVDEQLRADVANRARCQCEYCRYPERYAPSAFECDHICPKNLGGATKYENLALACSHCNSHKASRSEAIDPITRQVVRLFNPRLDDWDEHLCLNLETGEIAGLTPVGRATVAALQMNSDQPRKARGLLIQWGAM